MAAEAVVSLVVEQTATLLIKQAAEQIDLLTGIEKKVQNLADTLKSIQAVLADAERKSVAEESVKLWLQKLEDVAYEIDDVLDEWHYSILKQEIEGTSNNGNASTSIDVKQRVRSFTPPSCFCFKQVVVHRDIAIKIKEINTKLDVIKKQKDEFRFISNSSTDVVVSNSPKEWRPVQTTSFVDESEVVGREAIRNNLVNKLLNGKTKAIQILCLVGTGGIGKTTLAQFVYNDDRVKGHFGKRGWVCVSDPFDEIRIAKAISESFKSKSADLNELDSLLQNISKSISGKKFFLVFDDVWTEDEMKWASLKASLKHGALGSVILLTTRNEMVARAAGVTTQIPLGLLSELASWSLFYQAAISSQTNHIQHEREKLENIGRQIAKKCEGLPLALRIIGSFLRYKTKVEEWQKVLDSKLWDLKETKTKVFPHLYLSYNDLSSLLRSCFSYCAVFPKDKRIEVDDLVRLWMAQGYLNLSGSEDEIEVYGRECFENLAMRSFFQDFERDEYDQKITYCKMHDILHDFALHLRERECLAIEEGKRVTFFGNPHHITWLGVERAPDSLLDSKMGQARSFFVQCKKLEMLTTTHLLNNLKLVKTLSLQCGLEEIPNEIGNLIHLRYLDLSGNYVKELPKVVYNLFNLQTLNLSNCWRLKVLPPGIERLKMLRHLITQSLKFPAGIEELTGLQTLVGLHVGEDYNKLGNLKNLNQIQGSLEVTIVDNFCDTADAHNANLRSKKHIKKLKFKFEGSSVKVNAMEALEPPPNLHELVFKDYKGTHLPTWIESLDNLVKVQLDLCPKLTSLHPLARLPSLEKLEIRGLDGLECVNSAFWGIRESSPLSPAIEFPKLIVLEFYGCYQWKYWEEEKDFVSLMPCLRRLVICGNSELKTLPYRLLRKASSLEYFVLDYHKLNPSKFLSVAEALAEVKAGQTNHDRISIDGELQVKASYPTLRAFLDSKDDEELVVVLYFISRNKNDEIQGVIEAGLFEPLVGLLVGLVGRRHLSLSLLNLTLDAILLIAQGDDHQKQSIIGHGILSHLLNLLTNNQDFVIKESVCTIISSVITAGTKDHIQAVFEAGLFGPLVKDCFPTLGAANAILSAIHGGTDEQIKFLVSQGCLKHLVSSQVSDRHLPLHFADVIQQIGPARGVIRWLEAVERILKVGEEGEKNQLRDTSSTGDDHVNPFKLLIEANPGWRRIIRYRSHFDEEVQEKAVEILDRYWPEGVEEEET